MNYRQFVKSQSTSFNNDLVTEGLLDWFKRKKDTYKKPDLEAILKDTLSSIDLANECECSVTYEMLKEHYDLIVKLSKCKNPNISFLKSGMKSNLEKIINVSFKNKEVTKKRSSSTDDVVEMIQIDEMKKFNELQTNPDEDLDLSHISGGMEIIDTPLFTYLSPLTIGSKVSDIYLTLVSSEVAKLSITDYTRLNNIKSISTLLAFNSRESLEIKSKKIDKKEIDKIYNFMKNIKKSDFTLSDNITVEDPLDGLFTINEKYYLSWIKMLHEKLVDSFYQTLIYCAKRISSENNTVAREGLLDWFKGKNKDENSLKAIKNKIKNINPSACSSLVNLKLLKAQYETIKAISNMSNIQIEKLKNIHNNIDKISNVKLKTKYYCEKNTEWYGEAISLVEDDNVDFYNIITSEFDRLRDEVSNMDFYHMPIFPTLCYKDNTLHVGSLAAYVYGLNIERPGNLDFNKVIHVMTDLIIEPEVGLNKFSLGSNEVTEILNLINGMKDEDFKISSVTCSGFLKPMFSVSDKYHAEFIAECFDGMVKDFFKILNEFIADVEKEKELGTERLELSREGLFEIMFYGPMMVAVAYAGGTYLYDKGKDAIKKLLNIKDKAEVLKIENIEDPYSPSKAILKLCKHLGSIKEAINYINTLGNLKGRVYNIESMKNKTYYELAKHLKTKPVKNFKHVNFKPDKIKSELLENLSEELHDFLMNLVDTDKNKLKKIGFEDLGNLDIDSKEGHDKFLDKIAKLNTEVSDSLAIKVKNQEPLFIVPCNDRVYTFIKAIIEMEFKFNNKQWKTEIILQTFTDCDDIDVDGIEIDDKDAEQLKECLNRNRENIEKLFHYNSIIFDGYNCNKWFKDDCFIGNEFINQIGCSYDDYEPYYFESSILGKFVKSIYPNAKNVKVEKEHLSVKDYNSLTKTLDRQGVTYDKFDLIFGNDRSKYHTLATEFDVSNTVKVVIEKIKKFWEIFISDNEKVRKELNIKRSYIQDVIKRVDDIFSPDNKQNLTLEQKIKSAVHLYIVNKAIIKYLFTDKHINGLDGEIYSTAEMSISTILNAVDSRKEKAGRELLEEAMRYGKKVQEYLNNVPDKNKIYFDERILNCLIRDYDELVKSGGLNKNILYKIDASYRNEIGNISKLLEKIIENSAVCIKIFLTIVKRENG